MMDLKEVKQRVANAQEPEWFKTLEVTFSFSYIDYNVSLTGFTAIFEFVLNQMKGWNELGRVHREMPYGLRYFESIFEALYKFIEANSGSSSNILNSRWNGVYNVINNYNNRPLPFNVPEIEFLLGIIQDTPQYLKGAQFILLNFGNYNPNNKNDLLGALLAYEFKMKDHSTIIERRNKEKKSITRLRADFHSYLNESETHLLETISGTTLKYNEYVGKIDSLKTEKEEAFNNWFKDLKEEKWSKWYEPSQAKITELEETYNQKLKLEEPAKYWKERGRKMNIQGWVSAGIIAVIVLITCWSLGEILWRTPEQLYASWFDNDKSAAIRWGIVYITLISFIAFLIRAITKTMFSFFHIARDSEERHTLTYFYLSLLKDSKLDEKDRQLIMQSLFSRADTGLLKEDSSPAMPNDFVSKFISK